MIEAAVIWGWSLAWQRCKLGDFGVSIFHLSCGWEAQKMHLVGTKAAVEREAEPSQRESRRLPTQAGVQLRCTAVGALGHHSVCHGLSFGAGLAQAAFLIFQGH